MASELTPEQKATQDRVEAYAKRLLLNDWHITYYFPEEDPDDGEQVYAITDFAEHGMAFMTFYPLHFTTSSDTQNKTILHELCHMHQRRCTSLVETTEKALGKKAYAILYKAYDDAEEAMVQTFARILADVL